VPVTALFATIWANPKPPVLFLLHSIKKVLANLQNKIVIKTESYLKQDSFPNFTWCYMPIGGSELDK
jgi:hypothetical protein